jgi:hypothetical protein
MSALGTASTLDYLTNQIPQRTYFALAGFRDRLCAMIRRRKCLVVLGTLTCLMTVSAHAQRGALTVPRGLDQLTQAADVILRGYVTSTKIEPHPQLTNLMTVVVSMKVAEMVKGAPRKSIVFRQYVWDLRDQLDGAQYRKGEELLLLLGPVSENGLTSPVGLEQGRFRILRDKNGGALAVNGRGNRGLFDAVEKHAQARGLQLSPRVAALVIRPQTGPVPLADLEDAIRAFKRTR